MKEKETSVKKWVMLFLFLLTASSAKAGLFDSNVRSTIGPASSFSATVELSTPTVGRNCLTDIYVSQSPPLNTGFIVRILDGGTTMYTIPVSTGAVYADSWDIPTAPCSSPGSKFVINVSSASLYYINYRGFVK